MAFGFSFSRCFRYPGLDMGFVLVILWYLLRSVEVVVPFLLSSVCISFWGGIFLFLVKFWGFVPRHVLVNWGVCV